MRFDRMLGAFRFSILITVVAGPTLPGLALDALPPRILIGGLPQQPHAPDPELPRPRPVEPVDVVLPPLHPLPLPLPVPELPEPAPRPAPLPVNPSPVIPLPVRPLPELLPFDPSDRLPLLPPRFERGDVDGDGDTALTDGVKLLEFLFQSYVPGCIKTADVNDDGIVELSDAVKLLNFLFLGGPPPAPPFGACGEDPTPDALACASSSDCTVGGSGTGQIDFETFPDGSGIARHEVLRFQFLSRGVRFPRGVLVERCIPSVSAPCLGARSGFNAATSLAETEFRQQPLEIEFLAPQSRVSLSVLLGTTLPNQATTATLEAFNERGSRVDSDTANFTSDRRTWDTRLEVSSSEEIVRVVLRGGSSQFPDTNSLLIDDLRFYGANAAAGEDTQAPTITIVEPSRVIHVDHPRFPSSVLVEEETQLSEVSVRVRHESAREDGRWRTLCGDFTACPAQRFEHTSNDIGLLAKVYGRYTITYRACDAAGNCSSASFSVIYDTPPDTDVWVLGMEYNQGYQDVIQTDLRRGPAEGWVPLRQPSGSDTELAPPIIPGLPMVVRVYVGAREVPAAPASGVPVSGRLYVQTGGVGGPTRTLHPINNPDCTDFRNQDGRADGQACQATVQAYPTIGTLGLNTNTDHDLDLIAARSHLEGTLNFVIPADFMEEVAGYNLSLRVTVDPVGHSDITPADNAFRMTLQNVAPRRHARVRLVRVRLPGLGLGEPSLADALQVVEDMHQTAQFSEIEVVSDDVYVHDFSTIRIRASILGFEVVDEEIDACNSLWLGLFQRYGLSKEETVLALVPPGFSRTGCAKGGVGWRVPEIKPFQGALGGSGIPDYLGGIAWSVLPDADSSNRAYWDGVSVVAHEFYHAHLDARHESNAHGEGDGCFLGEGTGTDVLNFFNHDVLDTNIDLDCFKPARHPHGLIGSYPPEAIEIGVPGGPTGTFANANGRMNRIFGYLGGMGVRIEREEFTYKLTLVDPCPTGPVDRDDPWAVLSQRLNADSESDCALPFSSRPHSFMSYGPNRWIGGRTKPNVKNINWAF